MEISTIPTSKPKQELTVFPFSMYIEIELKQAMWFLIFWKKWKRTPNLINFEINIFKHACKNQEHEKIDFYSVYHHPEN